jgi:hypothetical protein
MLDPQKIEKALRVVGDTVTLADLLAAAQVGDVRAFHRNDSIVVCGIHNHALVYHLAAGERADVLAMLDEAVEWGRENGATRGVIIGRPGWKRFLTKLGWAVTGRLLMYERNL